MCVRVQDAASLPAALAKLRSERLHPATHHAAAQARARTCTHTHIHTHTHAHMHTQDAANVLWALAKLRFDPGYSALSPVLSSLSSGKHGAGGCVHTSSKPDRCARTP